MQRIVMSVGNQLDQSLSVRVIKLGGSLLELPDLRSRFEAWFARQRPAVNVMIVGGGELVEAVRGIDQQQSLDAAFVHWVSIDLMATTAKLASEILGIGRLIATSQELSAFLGGIGTLGDGAEPLVAVLQPSAYYCREDAARDGCDLPEDWSCTSDSIAAWLATQVGACELVLLKSTAVDGECSRAVSGDQLELLSQSGVVDAAFPRFARDVASVQLVNLRDAIFG